MKLGEIDRVYGRPRVYCGHGVWEPEAELVAGEEEEREAEATVGLGHGDGSGSFFLYELGKVGPTR